MTDATKKQTALAVLRTEARDWWAHKRLREQGHEQQAAQRERESIRSIVKILREAEMLTIDRSGNHYICENSRVSHYKRLDDPEIQLAIRLGIPTIDTTTISDANIVRFAVSEPMFCGEAMARKERAGEFPRAFQYISLREYAKIAKSYGATLYNFPL